MTPEEKRHLNSSRQYVIKKEPAKPKNGRRQNKPKVRSPHNSIQQQILPVFSNVSNESFKSAPTVEIMAKLTPDHHVHKLAEPIEEKVRQENLSTTAKQHRFQKFPTKNFASVSPLKGPKIPSIFKIPEHSAQHE